MIFNDILYRPPTEGNTTMSDQFKQPDTFRFSTEANATKVAEAKERVTRNSENLVIDYLRSRFGNVKLFGGSNADLHEVEGKSHEFVVFDGKVSFKTTLIDKQGTKIVSFDVPVKENKPSIYNDEIDQAVTNSPVVAPESDIAVDTIKAFPLHADLGLFRLVDNGDYLKVFHPVLESDKEIGLVSKNEYTFASDKEAFFKTLLEDQIKNSSWESGYELSYIGNFNEPTIEAEATPAAHTVISSEDVELIEEASAQLVDDVASPLALSTDTMRQRMDFEQQKTEASKARLLDRIANDVHHYLAGLRYSCVKVQNVTALGETIANVEISLVDTKGDKLVAIPIEITNGEYKMPKPEAVAEIVANTEDRSSILEKEIAAEAEAKANEVDAIVAEQEQEVTAILDEDKIKKTAGEFGGIQYLGPVETVQLNKHLTGLPDDMEVGSVIYADGFHWKLVSKSTQQLSKGENDASLWTFAKVVPEDKAPEHSLGI